MTPDFPLLADLTHATLDAADIVLQAGGPPSGGDAGAGGPSLPELPSTVPDGVQDVVSTALSTPGKVADAALTGVANAADKAIKAVTGVMPS